MERQRRAGSALLLYNGSLIEDCTAGLEACFEAANEEGAEEPCHAGLTPVEDPPKQPTVQIFLGKAGDADIGLH